MARAIDPTLAAILKEYGADPKTDIWDCHGQWVAYHRALERIAVKAAIIFDPPLVLEANGVSKSVALCVTGHMPSGDRKRSEWSIGEAAPGNNKNSYPYAMAEKRGKDRVILKLIGLHGSIYSEEEMDERNGDKPAADRISTGPQDTTSRKIADDMIEEIGTQPSMDALKKWGTTNAKIIQNLPSVEASRVRAEYSKQQHALDAAEKVSA